MKNITIEDFKENDEAFLFQEILKNTNQSIFLTGKAGTGKTTLVKLCLMDINKNVILLSQSAMAAKNIGGQTIHSFFSLPINTTEIDTVAVKNKLNANKIKIIKDLDLIVIDEISLTPSYILGAIDSLLRLIMGNLSPFGGKQILCIGDPLQLPPVVKDKEAIPIKYKSKFFFDIPRFWKIFYCIELKECYRQKEKDFLGILDKIKTNHVSDNELQILNDRCIKPRNSLHNTSILTSKNNTADRYNIEKLKALNTPLYKWEGVTEGNFNFSGCIANKTLFLREGAKIMFIKNNRQVGYINGTMGIVVSISDEKLLVEIKESDCERIVEVFPAEWHEYKYTNNTNPEIVGTLCQYPIILGWAISIHKSQGLTLPKVHIDLEGGIFEHGQLYVALSRVTSIEGLSISRKVHRDDIIVDLKVIDFYKLINSNHQEEKRDQIIDELLDFHSQAG